MQEYADAMLKLIQSIQLCWFYREFLEWRTPVTLLPSACACETPSSSAEESYCRLALDMPRIVNMYVHFWK
jgi:hypothetical protein